MTGAEILILLGRSGLGLFFIIAGICNFLSFSERARTETNYGWMLPRAVTGAGFVVQIVGGVAVTLGIWAVCGAGLLIVFLAIATALFHNPLMFKGEARLPHLYFALVNAALIGYCLLVIGTAE